MAKMNYAKVSKQLRANKEFVDARKRRRWRKKKKKGKQRKVAGLRKAQTLDRQSPRYTRWRLRVFARDKYHCQASDCSVGGRGVELHAHHIKAWIDNPELRYSLSNGQTLCIVCHVGLHPWMRKQVKYKNVPYKANKRNPPVKTLLIKKSV